MARSAKRAARRKRAMRGKLQPRVSQNGIKLSPAGAAWARLLADPCNAPLAPPCYTGAGGGILTRFEADYIFGGSTAETGFIFNYTPGMPFDGITATRNFGALQGTGVAVTETIAGALTGNGGGTVNTVQNIISNSGVRFPGQAFLTNQAQNARCVAACVQLYWTGSELNRQGIICYTNNSSGAMNSVGWTPSTARSFATIMDRVSNSVIEIRWKPNEADQEFLDVNTIPADVETAKHSSIFVACSGLPAAAGVGIRARFVVIYEWQPKSISGMPAAASSNQINRGPDTVNTVLAALDRVGQWAYTFGNFVASGSPAAQMMLGAGKMLAQTLVKPRPALMY